jgi:hypothetical protein
MAMSEAAAVGFSAMDDADGKGTVMPSGDREDRDGPEFVPRSFEAEYLEEARRTVAVSHRWSSRMLRRLKPSRLGGPRQDLTVLLALGHGAVGLLILVFAAVTDTWFIGSAMLLAAAASLSVLVYVIRRLPKPGADPDPGRGLDDRASRRP